MTCNYKKLIKGNYILHFRLTDIGLRDQSSLIEGWHKITRM